MMLLAKLVIHGRYIWKYLCIYIYMSVYVYEATFKLVIYIYTYAHI
jgi:hypothetical protein